MTDKKVVPLVEAANALDSMRNSDFDSLSAYGEVIDNSLQAEASVVKIDFAVEAGSHGYYRIQKIAFGDDGYGMNSDTIHHCLSLGWSSRFNDRSGIGRFGVGMTLGAIHECMKIEVWSKEKGGAWLYTYMDLQEVIKKTMKDVPKPIKKAIPARWKDLVGIDSGTLVVWSKYDRQSENATSLIHNFKIWAGRTYRYFIWDVIPPRKTPLSIVIDNETIKAIDPLYARTEKTRFPEDPKAKVYDDIVFSWPVDDYNLKNSGNTPNKSEIRIRLSLLPEELRPYRGSGGGDKAKARFIHMNDGISILRNGREVFYDTIPRWSSVEPKGTGWARFEEKDRWWGCEIHFDATLDRAFEVKNIKRGALPVLELRHAIKAKILPTRKTVMEEVDKVWAEYKRREDRAKEKREHEETLRREHEEAERIARKTPTDKTAIDEGKDKEVEIPKWLERKKEYDDEQHRAKLAAIFSSQPFSIEESHWSGSGFFEVAHLGGSGIIEYNLDHVFFKKIYGLLESLKSGEDEADDDTDTEADLISIAKEIKTMIDILLIAYVKAEARFAPDTEMHADEFIDAFRANWGQYLQSYVRTKLKDEEGK